MEVGPQAASRAHFGNLGDLDLEEAYTTLGVVYCNFISNLP